MLKKLIKLSVLFIVIATSDLFGQINETKDYMSLSQQLLEALKEGQSTEIYVQAFALSTESEISNQIKSDNEKIAFWVNIYNAYIQIRLKEKPERYNKRNQFFEENFIQIAGRNMSFSNIEHGIIRGSQWLYGLGRIRNPFAPGYQKRLCPSKREPRVHFALNCGAKSCPPVFIYDPVDLDDQLNKMTYNFLKKYSSYNNDENRVMTTPLFSWFRGDFGGKKGVKKMLSDYGVIPHTDVSLKFDDYDWTLHLDNFVEIEYH